MVNEYSIQKGGHPIGGIIGGVILTFLLVWSVIQSMRGCIFFKGGPFL